MENFRTKFRYFSFLQILVLLLSLALSNVAEAAQVPPPPTLPPVVLSPTPTSTPKPTTPTPVPTSATKTSPRATTSPAPTMTPTPSAPRLVSRPPTLSSPNAIAVDANTGRILYQKDPDRQVAQASTTKIMTALTLLSMTGIDFNAQTTIVQDDLIGEANMNLHNGERVKILTLLIGLLTNSANEAAMAIARWAGAKLPGPAEPIDRFVALMNAKALEYGMYRSHFMNPHGLDEAGHYSSARDLAISGWYALHSKTVMSIVGLNSYSFEGHDFYNVNSFVRRYPGATGIKPGWTDDAGRCVVASATNYGRTVLVVVMGASLTGITQDTDTLMDYSFSLLTGQAEAQITQVGPSAYLGLPDGDHLMPFDVRPLLELFHSIGTKVSQVFQAMKKR